MRSTKLANLLLITLISLTNLSHCLYSSDLCFKNKTCQGDYHYQCSMNICAKTKKFCSKYNLFKEFKECSLCKIMKPNVYEKEMRKLTQFIQKINTCPSQTGAFKSTDVCLNEQGCFEVKLVSLRFNKGVKFSRECDCKCPGNFSFKCGKAYCAKDAYSCEKIELETNKFSKNETSFVIKKCGNKENYFV